MFDPLKEQRLTLYNVLLRWRNCTFRTRCIHVSK